MDRETKKKIRAIEMTLLLIVSGSVGYLIITRQGASSDTFGNEQNNPTQETIVTTTELPPLTAHIDAGPVMGYPPLAVTFHGNPKNDSSIVSYNWVFGPAAAPIIPQSRFKTVHFSIVLFFLHPMLYLLAYKIISNLRYKANSQYQSTEKDPAMVFLRTGTYSATLTITDDTGNTSSDTTWITVLQYVPPDND
jgi:hypothetical protein